MNKENVTETKKAFGDYPIISVDFPYSKNERYAKVDQEQRRENLQHLLNELSKLENNCIEPEVLSPFQDLENDVSKIFSFVPVAGSVYILTSSGFYCAAGKKEIAKERLLDGSLKIVIDVVACGLIATIVRPAMTKPIQNISSKVVKAAIKFI